MAGDTLTLIRQEVRDYLREVTGTPGQYWTDTKVDMQINRALKKIEDLCLSYGPWFLETTSTATLTSGTNAYNFPTISGGTVRRVRELAVYAVGDSTSYPPRPLRELSLLEAHAGFQPPLRSTGIPAVFWFTDQDSVVISPTPNYTLANALVWQIYRSLALMTLTTDTIPTPDDNAYAELVTLMAVLKLLMMDEEVPSARYNWIKVEVNEKKAEFIQFLTKGRRTRPQQIRIIDY